MHLESSGAVAQIRGRQCLHTSLAASPVAATEGRHLALRKQLNIQPQGVQRADSLPLLEPSGPTSALRAAPRQWLSMEEERAWLSLPLLGGPGSRALVGLPETVRSTLCSEASPTQFCAPPLYLAQALPLYQSVQALIPQHH